MLTSANSKNLALVLMAVAFMLFGACIAAVGTESTDATIRDGDTGYIHTTWNSGDCVVTYDSQWVQRDSEGLMQYGDGILRVRHSRISDDPQKIDEKNRI